MTARTQTLDQRVSHLEGTVEALRSDIQSIGVSQQRIEEKLGRVGKLDWNTLMTAAFLILALAGAALTPMYIMVGHAEEKADASLKWQTDYSRGLIPSSAEAKLAAVEKMFAEVETQFRAFRERMLENEALMTQRSQQNTSWIEDNRAGISAMREQIGRLDERLRGLGGKIP